jgi:hypothetical protein
MSWISGNRPELGIVTGKATLIYATALVGLRLGERRTLAQWTIIDFAIAVAIGAIIGRTAIVSTQSFITGAAALLTLIAVHRFASLLGAVALCEAGAGEIVDPGWSDRQGQLIEGSRHPQRRRFLGPEFVVSAAEVLDEGVPGSDHPCAAELCEAAHRPQSGL